MAKYTEEQFIYFTKKSIYLESIKGTQETYWDEYRKLQDWLQEQQLSTSFISWVEKRMKK
jgi:homoserine trans-succinylase